MTNPSITIQAGTLLFSEDGTSASGLLVPYGVEAKSNLGLFKAESGSFEVPEDVTGMSLNVEHSREDVVGAVTRIWEQPEGLFASFSFAKTKAGQRAFMDAKDGKRKNLSVEAAGVVIQAGKAIAGRLFAAALVERPAFEGATLLAAEDTAGSVAVAAEVSSDPIRNLDRFRALLGKPELTEAEAYAERDAICAAVADLIAALQAPEAEDAATSADAEVTPATPTAITTPEAPAEEEEEVDNTTLPDTLTASETVPVSAKEMGAIVHAIRSGTASEQHVARFNQAGNFQPQSTLFAALSDIKYNAAGAPKPYQAIPQWLGDTYKGNAYEQRLAPLVAHADLTSMSYSGFKWNVKPSGGAWDGEKNAVPSSGASTTAVTGTAALWAGGHDIAVEHRLFNTPGFFEAYADAMVESYKRWADAEVATAIIAGATSLEADNPAGLSIGVGMSAIIDGAFAVSEAGYRPTFALVNPSIYKAILKTGDSNVTGYLANAIGLAEGSLEGFRYIPYTDDDVDLALVGAGYAATLFELGSVPVRVEAPDLVKGGVDFNFYGAAGVLISDAEAFVNVTPYTA